LSPFFGFFFSIFLLDVVQALEFSTEWNDKFQACFGMPATTYTEIVKRAIKLQQVYEEFVESATVFSLFHRFYLTSLLENWKSYH